MSYEEFISVGQNGGVLLSVQLVIGDRMKKPRAEAAYAAAVVHP